MKVTKADLKYIALTYGRRETARSLAARFNCTYQHIEYLARKLKAAGADIPVENGWYDYHGVARELKAGK